MEQIIKKNKIRSNKLLISSSYIYMKRMNLTREKKEIKSEQCTQNEEYNTHTHTQRECENVKT